MGSSADTFQLSDLKNTEDPYTLFEAARAGGSVQKAGGLWLVFGHAEGTELLRSSTARSGFIAELHRNRLPAGAAREEMSHRINFLDPPQHTRVRQLVSKAFTPRRTTMLRPFIERISRGLLDSISEEEPVDLIRAYAHEVPSLVISQLLGIPVVYRDRLTALSESVARLLSAESDTDEVAEAIKAAEEIHSTLREQLEERRDRPEDDLLSALLAAQEGDERLSESELLSLAATLYSAGHRTTRDLFSNGLAALLTQPELVSSLQDGSLPTEAVVEEFLRFETPTHLVARMVEDPIELGGHKISPGEPITILLAAANRDPLAYPDPETFDPWRWRDRPLAPSPLSFALGAHFCLGASLARLEVAVMLDALLEKFPKVRLADEPLGWYHTGLFRGLNRLPVILGPRR